jgi:hypothetical protein
VNSLDRKPPLEHFWKKADEVFYVNADFVDMLSSDESIDLANSDITAEDVDGADVTSDVVVIATKRIQDTTKLDVQIKGGTVSSYPYILKYAAKTDANNDLIVDVEMRIH